MVVLTPWRYDLVGASDKTLARPPGFDPKVDMRDDTSVAGAGDLVAKKKKRAMELAMGAGKSLPMIAFMSFMMGSGGSIITLFMLFNILSMPFKAIGNMENVFRQVSDVDLTMPKLVYIGLNLVGCCIGLYKCSTMGLLPLTSADWIHLLHHKVPVETSGIPLT